MDIAARRLVARRFGASDNTRRRPGRNPSPDLVYAAHRDSLDLVLLHRQQRPPWRSHAFMVTLVQTLRRPNPAAPGNGGIAVGWHVQCRQAAVPEQHS